MTTNDNTRKPIPGANPRLWIRKEIAGYSGTNSKNAEDRKPRYIWQLMVDGVVVEVGPTKRDLIVSAQQRGEAHIARVEASSTKSAPSSTPDES